MGEEPQNRNESVTASGEPGTLTLWKTTVELSS